jgi:uncharacterized membrane protein YhaH (DUF805 family)
MSFLDAVRTVLTKYAVLDGRARRTEYWYYTLAYVLVFVALLQLEHGIGSRWPTTILTLALFLPSLAVSVRRLHDTDRSGWWLLFALVPFLGLIVLVFFIQDGTTGKNSYGPDPRGR